MNWVSQHKGLFLALIIAVALAVWYGLSQGESGPLLTSSAPTAAGSSEEQDLVSTLLALRAVTLSGTIFQDPAFTSLHDNGTTIVAEPVGRDNPFAPIDDAAVSSGSPDEAEIFGSR